jgi:uncharacterized phage protein gp47/JayE
MTQSASIPLFTVQSKTRDQIRDDILRTISNGLRLLGIPNPNTGPNSDYWYIAQGVANEVCVGQANGIVNTNNQMPDTAAGAFLDRWLAIFGLARKGATNSAGVILPTYSLTTGYTVIPGSPVGTTGGAQLLDSAGLRYQVTVGGSYGPGNPGAGQPANLYVPVESVDTGAATNHQNGDTLTWVTLVPYVANTAAVGTQGGSDGMSGGNDSEATQDEPPRARLFGRLQNPPTGGNWPDVAQWCTDSSPDVQAGFVYPALQGPATVFFCAIQAPQTAGVLTSTSKNRALPSALVTGTLIPFVQGLYSARAAVIGTSANNRVADVALLISLPSAPTAQPAGPGGGWLDGTPWPSSVGGTAPCVATAVASSTVLTVNATTPPIKGVSHVAYISPSNWQLYTATVTGFSGTTGAYVITLDTPWPNIVSEFGSMIPIAVFPQSVQQSNYLAAMLQGFANLGPGEWTNSAVVLVRSFRHPSTSQTWFANLDANFLRTVENAGQEVLSARFLYLNPASGVPDIPTTPTITTSEPLVLTSPSTMSPYIFVPRSLSLYAA